MPAPRDHATLARVARLYYLQQRSQQQIADELEISRSSVSRMLSAALERGVVEIRIHDEDERDLTLERSLIDALGLRDARVVRARSGGDPLPALARTAADLLTDLARDASRIAISWGRTLQAVVLATHSVGPHDVEVVQLVGGLPSVEVEINAQELVRELATRLQARSPHYLHAPAVVSSSAARTVLLAEPSVAATLQAARTSDVAFVGVGEPHQGSSARVLETIFDGRPAAARQFWASKPVGDVALRYVSLAGEPIQGGVDERVVGLSAADLRGIPLKVGVAYGAGKAAAALAAHRAGLLDVLVCDDAMANSCIEIARHPVAAPSSQT